MTYHPARDDDPSSAQILLPGEGYVIEVGTSKLVVKESGKRTGGRLAIIEFQSVGHFHPPPMHIHHGHAEGFYVLEGELDITVGDQTVRAAPGSFLMAPIGMKHTFGNPIGKMVRVLITLSPDLYVKYFEEVAPLFAAAEFDDKAVREIMARYQTEVVD